jgi:hypothetical protein
MKWLKKAKKPPNMNGMRLMLMRRKTLSRRSQIQGERNLAWKTRRDRMATKFIAESIWLKEEKGTFEATRTLWTR